MTQPSTASMEAARQALRRAMGVYPIWRQNFGGKENVEFYGLTKEKRAEAERRVALALDAAVAAERRRAEPLVEAADALVTETLRAEDECSLCHWTDEEDQTHDTDGAYLGRVCPAAVCAAAIARYQEGR